MSRENYSRGREKNGIGRVEGGTDKLKTEIMGFNDIPSQVSQHIWNSEGKISSSYFI